MIAEIVFLTVIFVSGGVIIKGVCRIVEKALK